MNTLPSLLLFLSIVNNWLLLPISSYPSNGIGQTNKSLELQSDEHKRFKRSLADALDAGDFEESALPIHPEINPFEYQPMVEDYSPVESNDFDTSESIESHELPDMHETSANYDDFSNPEYGNEFEESENYIQPTQNDPTVEDLPKTDEVNFDDHGSKFEMPNPAFGDEHFGENKSTDSEYDDLMSHQLTSGDQGVEHDLKPNEESNSEHDATENDADFHENFEDKEHENERNGIIGQELLENETTSDHLANSDESVENEDQNPENPIETPSKELEFDRKTPIEESSTIFGDETENVTEMEEKTLHNEQISPEDPETPESSSVIRNEPDNVQVGDTENVSENFDDQEPRENFGDLINHTETEPSEENLIENPENEENEPISGVINETPNEDLRNGDAIFEHEEPNRESSDGNLPEESKIEKDTSTSENLVPNEMPEMQNGNQINEEPSFDDAKHFEPVIQNEPDESHTENTVEKSVDLENQKPTSVIETENTENSTENLTETTNDVKMEPKMEPAKENQQNGVSETQTVAPDSVIEPRTVPTNTESDDLNDLIGNELVDNDNDTENEMSPLKLAVILVIGPTIAMIILIALSIIIRKKVDKAKGRSVVYELNESLGMNKNGKDVIST